MRKDFRFHYFWLYFVYQNLQNGYFWISLFSVLLEVFCGKWIIVIYYNGLLKTHVHRIDLLFFGLLFSMLLFFVDLFL